MLCLPKNGAIRRYIRLFASAMSAYIALTLIVVTCFHRLRPTGPFTYLLAVLSALAIIAMIITVGLYLAKEKDEFQRNLLVRAMLWGLGGVMAVSRYGGCWNRLLTFRTLSPLGHLRCSGSWSASVRRFLQRRSR